VKVKESFVDFLHLTNKDAESLNDIMLSKIIVDCLNIQDCSYNNRKTFWNGNATTAFLQINRKAQFVPCDYQNLSLSGVHAATAGMNSVTFLEQSNKFLRSPFSVISPV